MNGVICEETVSQHGAVELFYELPYFSPFVLYHVQAENAVQLSIILRLQDRDIFVQLGKTSLKSQQQTLQLQGL